MIILMNKERGNEMKDFISFIKNYPTRDFIYLFSKISIEIYKKQLKHNEEDMNCCMNFPLNIIGFGFVQKQVMVMLSAWDIQDMAYLSVKHLNDYRNGNLSFQEVGTIVNLYRKYENEHSKSEFLKDVDLSEVFKFMMGMTYEQFKYQNLAWQIQNYCRNYHILIDSPNINREKIIDINQITNELFGLGVDELLAVEMMILWLASIYLDEKQWFKIPEQKKKSADYLVEFDDVILLFELKSGLLGIGAKQQVPDIQQIDTFYKRNILEAYEQLKNSEEEFCGEKQILKIFLLYESATNMQIIMA